MDSISSVINRLKRDDNPDVMYYISTLKNIVNSYIEDYLPSSSIVPVLSEAMRYSLTAGGKRIRPILSLISYFLSGGEKEEDIIPISVGFEMIHTYTLIHDDLPSMDNDDFRRGKPTCHKVFGEDMAILAGDALFTHAFDIFLKSKVDTSTMIKFLKEVVTSLGLEGVVGGQALDVIKNKERTPWLLRKLHRMKTASFISLCFKTGPIIAGNMNLMEPLSKIGMYTGMLFQITDDILDEEGTRELLGKSPGKDRKEGKLTYPSLYGIDGAKRRADCYLNIIVKEVDRLGPEFKFFKKFATYIRYRNK